MQSEGVPNRAPRLKQMEDKMQQKSHHVSPLSTAFRFAEQHHLGRPHFGTEPVAWKSVTGFPPFEGLGDETIARHCQSKSA